MRIALEVARMTLWASLYLLSSHTRVTSKESGHIILVFKDIKSNQAPKVPLAAFKMVKNIKFELLVLSLVCFDLLDPKLSVRVRQLKKGGC